MQSVQFIASRNALIPMQQNAIRFCAELMLGRQRLR